MKIALIGYGRMGHLIENIARERGHEIVAIIDKDNLSDFDGEAFSKADVAIEFTTPDTAVDNLRRCIFSHIPVVSGTTGWQTRREEIKSLCEKVGSTVLWSSNFSLGVNLFFAINRRVASLMGAVEEYTPYMTEIHHIHKLDHPSGTAVTLAEQVVEATPRLDGWSEEPTREGDKLIVNHVREGEVPGTHIIRWDSPVDAITIEHQAKSREGFALGAVMAAEWAAGRKGWLTLDDFMSEKFKV